MKTKLNVIIKNFGSNTGSDSLLVYWTGNGWSADKSAALVVELPQVEPGLIALPEDAIGNVAGVLGACFEDVCDCSRWVLDSNDCCVNCGKKN